jgi:ABC-type phosphonate transport system ATPase subunit
MTPATRVAAGYNNGKRLNQVGQRSHGTTRACAMQAG